MLIKFKSIVLLSLCVLSLFVACEEERDELEINDNLSFYDSRVTFSGNKHYVDGSGAAILSTDIIIPDDLIITGYGHCWNFKNRAPLLTDNSTSFGQTSLKRITITSKIPNYYNCDERAYILTSQGIIYDITTYKLK